MCRLAVGLIGALLIAGCAGQSAFRNGQEKLARGQMAEALADFEEASRLEPGSAEYRIAYTRTRDRLVLLRTAQADRAQERGEWDAAEAGYRQALAQDGSNERALQGLRQIDQQRRWDRIVKRAEAAAARKDWDGVRNDTRLVLLENPKHPRALALRAEAEQAAKPADANAAPERALAAAYRKPLSIEFRDATIKTVFEVIARSSGLNFVFDREVRTDQKTSIYLKNSTIESAVSMVLVSNQLEQRVLDANTVLIYPNTAAKQKDYQQLTVRSFYLANADAKTVAATLKSLLKLRDAVVDEKLNLVIVRDTPEAIRIAEKVVALHDVPEAEVMLDVEILEVKRTRLLDLGIRWPDQLSLTPLPSSSGGTLTLSDLRNLNSGTVGASVSSLTITAKKTDTDANLLANPRIRARNREKARIHIGERVPNITTTSTSTGFVAESINYVDVGLKLDVEPTIFLDNEVAIRVSLEVSSIISQVPTKSGTLAYQIGTRSATTVLRLKDGENQVLAGLINDEDRRTANKVPGLGEAPVLGRLFGGQADDTAKTEIVLSITPRVLRNVQRPEASALEFESGTESYIGSRGAEAAPGGAAARPNSPAPASTPSPSPNPTAAPSSSTSTNTVSAGTSVATGPVVTGASTAPPNTLVARWDGPASVKVGDVFTVQLLAQSDQPVTAVPLVLSMDPKSVQVTAVTEGAFLRQGGGTTNFSHQVDPSGQVMVTTSRSGTGGATNEAALLSLSLKLIARPAEGETRLQVLNLAPMGLQGRALAGQAPAPLIIGVTP